MVASSMFTAELKHNDKCLIPPLENYTQASRKYFNPGLGKGRGTRPAYWGGSRAALQL